jgi:hypothetical protein
MISMYAQIQDLASLRDVEIAIKSPKDDWEDIGVASADRTTLAETNVGRCCVIYVMIQRLTWIEFRTKDGKEKCLNSLPVAFELSTCHAALIHGMRIDDQINRFLVLINKACKEVDGYLAGVTPFEKRGPKSSADTHSRKHISSESFPAAENNRCISCRRITSATCII